MTSMLNAVHLPQTSHYPVSGLSQLLRHRKQDRAKARVRKLELAYDGLNETIGRLDLPADARLRLWQIRGDVERLLLQEGALDA
jgi:hypothetical protein